MTPHPPIFLSISLLPFIELHPCFCCLHFLTLLLDLPPRPSSFTPSRHCLLNSFQLCSLPFPFNKRVLLGVTNHLYAISSIKFSVLIWLFLPAALGTSDHPFSILFIGFSRQLSDLPISHFTGYLLASRSCWTCPLFPTRISLQPPLYSCSCLQQSHFWAENFQNYMPTNAEQDCLYFHLW